MKYIYYIVLMALLFVNGAIFAQQESAIILYRSNMNIVNPAYAGVDNETIITTSVRTQWSSIPEAPNTKTVSFGTPLGNNLGIGISIINDKTFVENQTSLGIDFSYKLKMNENTDLYFGIKAGGNFYDVNTTGLETYNIIEDPALGAISNFNPNFGSGALLKHDKWFASLSVPKLLSATRARNESGYAITDFDRPHVYLSGGYDFDLNPNFNYYVMFKPTIMVRYVKGAPLSIDLNLMLEFSNNFNIGVMYRVDKAYAAMTTLKISENIKFGFAHEVSVSPTLLGTAGFTNELLLQFKL